MYLVNVRYKSGGMGPHSKIYSIDAESDEEACVGAIRQIIADNEIGPKPRPTTRIISITLDTVRNIVKEIK